MKKTYLLLLFVSFTSSVFGQIYELTFPNGETKKFNFNYDDPYRLPKISLEASFFTFNTAADGALAYQLKPIYRPNNKLWFDGQLTMPYSRRFDGTIDYRNPEDPQKKLTIDFTPLAHYKIWNKIATKEKKHAVDFEHTDSTQTVFVAKLPRSKEYALELDAGFLFYRSNASSFQLESLRQPGNFNPDTSFDLTRYHSTSISAGLSFRASESYEMVTDGNTRSYWRSGRIYFDLTYALFGDYSVYYSVYPYSTSSASDGTTGYTEPTFNRMGFRIGYDKTFGTKKPGLGYVIGFEAVVNPGFVSNTKIGYSGTPSSFICFNSGLVFGTKQ